LKKCTKCKEIKGLGEFNRRAKAADGLTHYCKVCLRLANKNWRQANPDKVVSSRKAYVAKNRDEIREKLKVYRTENADEIKAKKAARYLENRETHLAKVKANTAKNKESIAAYQRAYREANRARNNVRQKEYFNRTREARNAYQNAYAKRRKAEDPVFLVASRMRGRLGVFFNKSGFGKPAKTYELIGCSFSELKTHLESLFTEGMGWHNRELWHIDHKTPLSSAKTPEDLKALFHYTNLQPLWAADNFAKGARMPEEAA
jgi:hypothetical protein